MTKVDYKHELDKVMTEKEAVETFIKDGDTFTLGGFFNSRRCWSTIREIIRQKKKDLTFVDTAAGFDPTVMVAAGCLRRMEVGYFFMRTGGIKIDETIMLAVKEGIPNPLEIEDYSQFHLAMGFLAGSLDVPYMPTRSSLGTDILKYNTRLKVVNDPFENKPLVLVPAIRPDVGFFSVQRADRRGNAQIFGDIWADDVKSRACKHVVVITEELVPTEVIQKYPTNTLIPSYCVDAVVELPFHCHPQGSYGVYYTDMPLFYSMAIRFLSKDGVLQYLDEWVYGTEDHIAYCDKVGWRNLMRLAKMEKCINAIPG